MRPKKVGLRFEPIIIVRFEKRGKSRLIISQSERTHDLTYIVRENNTCFFILHSIDLISIVQYSIVVNLSDFDLREYWSHLDTQT